MTVKKTGAGGGERKVDFGGVQCTCVIDFLHWRAHAHTQAYKSARAFFPPSA
jgi:hypothetical protein